MRARYMLISVLLLIVAGLCVLMLLNTTVIHADEWNTKGIASLNDTIAVPPMRGEILASDGSILATNLHYYNIRIDYRASKINELRYLESIDSLADTLAHYYPRRTRAQWYELLAKPMRIAKAKRSRSYLVLKHIPYEDVQRVRNFPYFRRSRNANRTGLTVERVLLRRYPYGEMARLSIGRVGETAFQSPGARHLGSGAGSRLDALWRAGPGRQGCYSPAARRTGPPRLPATALPSPPPSMSPCRTYSSTSSARHW